MAIWQQEANRRWKSAWIGGTGPFACVVAYHRKETSVTLFRKSSEAKHTNTDWMHSNLKRGDGNQPKSSTSSSCVQTGRRRQHGVGADALAFFQNADASSKDAVNEIRIK